MEDKYGVKKPETNEERNHQISYDLYMKARNRWKENDDFGHRTKPRLG